MAVPHGIRSHNKLSGRYIRKRRDSEEENLYLDFNRDPADVTHEVLFNVVNQDVNLSRKLGYLNGLVRFCLKQPKNFGVPYKDILCCLRTSLFHEACEVRAAGLRACRNILHDIEALNAFLLIRLDLLVCRSLDISLDNRIERVQALRLMRKVLNLDPHHFPPAFLNCLVAIANEGTEERDMIRPCLATLSQLAVLNPTSFINANGVQALIKNVVGNSQIQVSEGMLGAILYLYNFPHTRCLLNPGLESLLAPFTDSHYRFPTSADGSASEDKDPNLTASKAALVSTLLSWPGLIYMCKSDSCHLQSLVDMLYLPYPDLRKNILDLLYQVFDVPIPEWTDEFTTALNSCDPSSPKSYWQLYEGYIVAEGMDVLPYCSKDRMNLVNNFLALLVLIFVNCGLLEALSKMIVSSEIHLCVRATIFLGEFIFMANQYLPIDCSHLSNCLPTLISSAAAFESSKIQCQAAGALSCLFHIHELKKKGAHPSSLVLNNILHVCNPNHGKNDFFSRTVNKIKLWKYLKKEMNEGIDQAIKDTQVLSKNYLSWDWDLIDCILKNPSNSLKRLEDANHRFFMKKLINFYKPCSKEFSEMELDKENGRQICIAGCHLFEFFLELEEIKAQEFVDEFLFDLNTCLLQLITDNNRLNSTLSPIKVTTTFSQIYFLFIGRLSSSQKGCKFLHRCNTFQNLLRIVNTTNQDIYIKLIVSALDYTKEGFSRAILTKVLTGTEEATRLYATNFLLVLLRAKLPDYRKWAIEVLVYQLHDTSKLVSMAALDILDETCTIPENLEALISLRPSLLQLGDKGLLLLVRYLSVQSGFNFLRDSNFLSGELERWQQVYNFKYVKIVEDMLNEAFTHHKRNESGSYGRRSSEISNSMHPIYLPTHMYGQLAQHVEGVKMIESDILSNLVNQLHYPNFSSELGILHLKASLWAVGHIGSYPLGLEAIIRENVIQCITELASNAPVLTVRGTCYFVMGLLCSTPEGVSATQEFGWEAVQRNREEKWPLIRDEFFIDTGGSRKSTWSFNSLNSEWAFGPIPSNLSFIFGGPIPTEMMRGGSQNSSSSSIDHLQSSADSKSFLEVQSQYVSFTDSEESRQRSSSDCQPGQPDNPLFHMSESSSWDTLDTCSSFSPPSNFNKYAKRRSISTSEVITFDFNPSEQEEADLDDSKTNFPEINVVQVSDTHSTELIGSRPPAPSNLSISSSKSSDLCPERPSLLKQLSREKRSSFLQSPDSPEKSLLLTSARDALGYATLKDIQRRRVNSLSFHDSTSSNVDMSIRYLKSQSLDADTARIFNVTHGDFLPEAVRIPSKSDNLSTEAKSQVVDNRYIGLCLPSDLNFLFCVPKPFTGANSKDTSFVADNQQSVQHAEDVFEYHSSENCISNHAFSEKRCLQRIIIDEESEESSPQEVNKSSETFPRKIPPFDRSNSLKGLIKSKDDSLNNQVLIHKEIMRFVTNLSSSVAVTASEQGLLNLKQKFPTAFHDVCLYTEISDYMAHYSFRLTARRFLQELFLDGTFEQLQVEAEAIVGKHNIPQIDVADA